MSTVLSILIAAAIGYAIFRAIQSSKTEDADLRNIKKLPASVQNAVSRMDPMAQNAFFSELARKRKKTSVAYLLWLLFGFHYIYTGKVGIQILFWLTAGGFFLWWFVDLFRVPSIVRSANEGAARDALQTLAAGMAFGSPATA